MSIIDQAQILTLLLKLSPKRLLSKREKSMLIKQFKLQCGIILKYFITLNEYLNDRRVIFSLFISVAISKDN